MNLNRVQTRQNKMVVRVTERFPNRPVLKLNAHRDGSRHSITLNRRALGTLNVNDTRNRLIAFNNYDVSIEGNRSELDLVVGVVSDRIIKLDKQYKSYDIHGGTRSIKSKEIYTNISNHFKITDNTIDHYFELNPVGDHANETYRLNRIENNNENNDDTVELDVNFNKGENVEVTEMH